MFAADVRWTRALDDGRTKITIPPRGMSSLLG
jgi:hypothetical protein